MIELLMREITNLGVIDVFSVTLTFTDHASQWLAVAHLRADDRSITVHAESPERALNQLKMLILSLVCPCCHQLKVKKEEEE